jgi:hypothetical protein
MWVNCLSQHGSDAAYRFQLSPIQFAHILQHLLRQLLDIRQHSLIRNSCNQNNMDFLAKISNPNQTKNLHFTS